MIRTMRKGEALPPELKTGYERGNSMPEWIFLAEEDGQPTAILVAAPAHIVVVLMRVVATPKAKVTALRSLLLYFLETIRERGYNGYFVMINPEIQQEAALGRIVEATGGVKIPEPHYFCVGVA
jgi:hypothetical protein